jgi:hypothetical protein
MKKIVLLGDCIATGQSLAWPEITGDEDFMADALDCAKDKFLEKKLVSWYLRTHKEKINIENVVHHSLKAKIKKEKGMSWVSRIPNCLNLAVAGETFQGMHKKIKEIIATEKIPSMVLITCFAAEHRCVVINRQKKKFVIKRDIGLLEENQSIWPIEVYKEFVSKVKEQEPLGEHYQKRKNKKSFHMLKRLLDTNKIPYKFLLFRKENSYISNQYEDLSDLQDLYRDINGNESLARKYAAQPEIAKRVIESAGL